MKTRCASIVVLLLIFSADGVGVADQKNSVSSILQRLENRVVRIGCVDMSPSIINYNACQFHGVIFRDQLVLTTKHGTRGYDSFYVEGNTARAVFKSALYDYMVVRVYPGYGLDVIKFAHSIGSGDMLFMSEKQGEKWGWIGPGKLVEIGSTELAVYGMRAKIGDSGKPVFNQKGELVGLVQAVRNEYTYLIPANIIEEQLLTIDQEIGPFFFK
jgi:hypothetical protein